MRDYTISCIIPTYNRAHLVCDDIDSDLAQTYPCHEIIVVDDASPVHCADIADEYSRKNSRVQVIRKQKNSVQASTRNVGVAA